MLTPSSVSFKTTTAQCSPNPATHSDSNFGRKDVHAEDEHRSCAVRASKDFVKSSRDSLGRILASHPILHPAQEGFLPGGSSHHCINTVLDVWEHAHEQRAGAAFSLFYDIKQAYDTVRHDDITLALQRLRMPVAFVEFVADSLRDVTSCVRTPHGRTADFPVTFSDRVTLLLHCLLPESLAE